MDVEDAFTEGAISGLGPDAAEETDDELKDVITRICISNELDPMTDDHMNVAMLCFVAGRTYQSDLNPDEVREDGLMTIALTPKAVGALVNQLLETIAEGSP